MTKREKADLRRAVHHLYEDDGDGWAKGMRILLKLAGLRSPALGVERGNAPGMKVSPVTWGARP